MKSVWSIKLLAASALIVALLIPATTGMAQDTKTTTKKEKMPTRVSRTQTAAEGYAPVEMFAAMEAGTIEVELIPKDATQCNIFVTNNSDEPLAIEMPEAFVGVPVLAQGFGGGQGGGGRGGGGQGGGGQQGGGGNQGLGGGSGGGQQGGGQGGGRGGGRGGGGGGGLGGGVFNVPPGKRAKVQITTVCLEFGKRDPRPSVKYEIKPISDYVKDESIIEMIKMIANDEISQQVAQAAIWHKTDELSWNFLLNHNRKELSNGYYERFFAPEHIGWAQEVVTEANYRAELRANDEKSSKDDWKTESSDR